MEKANIDYTLWSDEYRAEADKLKKKVKKLKNELAKKERNNEPGVLELKRRITILYSMYLDCRKTAEILAEKGGADYAKKLDN